MPNTSLGLLKPSTAPVVSLQRLRPNSRTSFLVHCAASVQPPAVTTSSVSRKKLAVFVSGGGSNFKAIHAATLDGRINADVQVVVSDKPECAGWRYAEEHGIATEPFPVAPAAGADAAAAAEALRGKLCETHAVDYVVLAGFLKLVPEAVVRAYWRAMLNIHPALLPAFGGKGLYGARVHRAVIASGVRWSGPSVHFVDADYDTGPILAQRVVPVLPSDTPAQLAARVLAQEHALYPEAVAALVDGRVTWRADGVPILWSAH